MPSLRSPFCSCPSPKGIIVTQNSCCTTRRSTDGRDRLQALALLLQLALAPRSASSAARFFCASCSARFCARIGASRGSASFFTWSKNCDRRRRDVERVQLGVGIDVEILEEGAVRLALAALVEERKPEQPVRLGAQLERLEAARLHQGGEQLRGLRVVAVLERAPRLVHRVVRRLRLLLGGGPGCCASISAAARSAITAWPARSRGR